MNSRLLKALKAHQTIGVFSHARPDGDALGSQVALSIWLKNMGKNIFAFNPDPFPDNLKWMEPFFPVQQPDANVVNQCEAYVFLDGNKLDRFGEVAAQLGSSGRPCYMIDHHPDPEMEFDDGISRPDIGSTAELVYDLICEHDSSAVTAEMAKALYAGIITDTGSLRFDSVRPQTHRIVADLLESGGFSPPEIHEAIYDNNEIRHLKLLGAALKKIELFNSNQLATMSVTQATLDEAGCTYADLEGFVAYPLSLKQTKAAFLLCEKDGRIKLSLRSKSSLDVNKLARNFEGGGHQKAAGGWHDGPIEQAVKDVVDQASKQLN